MAESDLVLDMDWNISKAEAKARKLQREYNNVKKEIESKKIEISTTSESIEKTKNNIKKLKAELEEIKDANLTAIAQDNPEEQRETYALLKAKKAEIEEQNQLLKKQQDLYDKQELSLEKAKNKAADIGDEILLNGKKTNKFADAFKKSQKSADRFGKRLKSLIASALFFSVVTKAFTALREEFGKLINETGTKTASLIAQLKGNLAVLGRTLYEGLRPQIEWILEKLVHITYLLTFSIAKALGKNVEEMQKLADKTKEVEKSSDKTTASFDTIQKLNAPSKSETPTLDTGTSNEKLKETEELLRRIMPLVTAIGLGIAAWNIIGFLKQFETLNNYLTGGKITGILMIVVGLVLAIWNYCDAWANGIDWINFAGIIAGIALTVGGLALLFGSIGAGIGLIVGGIAMVILGIKDWIENGKSLESVLTVVVGIIAVGIGLMMLGLGWPALLVAAIVAAIVLIAAYWEEIKTAVSNFIDWFSKNVLDNLFGKGVGDALRGMWDSFTGFFEDFIAFFKNVFTGKWKEAGKSFVNIFINLINFGINKLNLFIQGLLGGGAKLINAFGKLFGQKWNLDASNIKIPTIPKLATGAILPGGSPMLAWVNDQPKGQPYLEGSIDNIAAAFEKYLGGNGGAQNINVNFTGTMSQLVRALAPEISVENNRASIFARG